jgi:hypothetical protein
VFDIFNTAICQRSFQIRPCPRTLFRLDVIEEIASKEAAEEELEIIISSTRYVEKVGILL